MQNTGNDFFYFQHSNRHEHGISGFMMPEYSCNSKYTISPRYATSIYRPDVLSYL